VNPNRARPAMLILIDLVCDQVRDHRTAKPMGKRTDVDKDPRLAIKRSDEAESPVIIPLSESALKFHPTLLCLASCT
jgi:hypothetical protein